MPRSPIEVTYDEIFANPRLCENNPLDARPDIMGSIILWEGHKDPKNLRSPVFKIVKTKENKLEFYRYDKRESRWVQEQELKENKKWFGRPKREEDETRAEDEKMLSKLHGRSVRIRRRE